VTEAADPTDDHADTHASVDGAESTDMSMYSHSGESMIDTLPVDSVDGPAGEGAADSDEADDVAADPSLEDPTHLVSAIEAILFVVDTPLSTTALAAALRQPVPTIEVAIVTLRQTYDDRDAGVELRDSAGGVRFYTRPAHARHVERFLQDGQRSRLSQAALETLAVIAYRQPVTRSRVSAIRGVNVDGVVRTLLTRGLIVEVGTEPESGAGLFRTSELFLERMGMQTLEELPSLAPLLPDLDGLETEEL
jgi:segregation and condensation protein B